MTICVDFDGTCVTHDFPRIGKDIGAADVLRALTDVGHRLILFTMRSDVIEPKSDDPKIIPIGGNYLTAAVDWFMDNNIPLWGIQTNPNQKSWTHSPKAYAALYIDDAGIGCPLIIDPKVSDRPFVDWSAVRRILEDMLLIPIRDHENSAKL
jgi:hypothetical protein